MLSTKEGVFTDEDIETLLARGEERTNEINTKLSTEVQHSLAKFSVVMDDFVEMNMFTFEGENFKGDKKKGGRRKRRSLAERNENSFMIALPQRERKKNYDSQFLIENPTLAALVKFSFFLLFSPLLGFQSANFEATAKESNSKLSGVSVLQ